MLVFVDFAQKQFEHKSFQRQTRRLTRTCSPRRLQRARIRNPGKESVDGVGLAYGFRWAVATLKLTVSFTRSSSSAGLEGKNGEINEQPASEAKRKGIVAPNFHFSMPGE